MNVVRDKHNEAMDLSEAAFVARMRGDLDRSRELSLAALHSELAAIDALGTVTFDEPTFSVLHRSAATLALDCNDPLFAEKIASKALAGNPPGEIADELRDLLEQIHFHRHLMLRGVTLGDDELQMSLSGRGVGFGVVPSEELMQRVSTASKAIYRIVERRSGRQFRERGQPARSIRNNFEVFLSVPRAASFAVTLKVGQPADQLELPGIRDTTQVVDEFLDLMELANQSRLDEIHRRVPDPAYFRNIVALAKQLAPDGVSIRQVGFTAWRANTERYLQITTPRSEISAPEPPPSESTSRTVSVSGHLRFADATQEQAGIIKIVSEDGHSHDVKVPEGMMSDIVRPMWDALVVVSGHTEGRYIILTNIDEA